MKESRKFDNILQYYPALGDLINKIDQGEEIGESEQTLAALLVARVIGLVGFDEESGTYKRLDSVQDKN